MRQTLVWKWTVAMVVWMWIDSLFIQVLWHANVTHGDRQELQQLWKLYPWELHLAILGVILILIHIIVTVVDISRYNHIICETPHSSRDHSRSAVDIAVSHLPPWLVLRNEDTVDKKTHKTKPFTLRIQVFSNITESFGGIFYCHHWFSKLFNTFYYPSCVIRRDNWNYIKFFDTKK